MIAQDPTAASRTAVGLPSRADAATEEARTVELSGRPAEDFGEIVATASPRPPAAASASD